MSTEVQRNMVAGVSALFGTVVVFGASLSFMQFIM